VFYLEISIRKFILANIYLISSNQNLYSNLAGHTWILCG